MAYVSVAWYKFERWWGKGEVCEKIKWEKRKKRERKERSASNYSVQVSEVLLFIVVKRNEEGHINHLVTNDKQ